MPRSNPYDARGDGRFDWRRWDDLRFPANGLNPAGSPAPAGVDTATGCLVFAGNQDNVVGGIAQMPHAWAVGTTIRPHIHLRFPTSNAGKNTRWQFFYDVAAVDGTFTNASGTYSSLTAVTIANPASVNKHAIVGLGDLTMTGFHESAVILWQVHRLAASDVLDDDTSDCLLMEFDIHYQIEKTGTVAEYPS